MKTDQQFKFIEGEFSPQDARRVLLSLIAQKINHHQIELFSNMERFGYDPSHSQKRITELNNVYSEMESVFEYANEKGLKINVRSNIELFLQEAE